MKTGLFLSLAVVALVCFAGCETDDDLSTTTTTTETHETRVAPSTTTSTTVRSY